MRKLFASALLILATFVVEIPTAGPQPGAQSDVKLVIAQRFCPNGRC
jgi:hypothetical protein